MATTPNNPSDRLLYEVGKTEMRAFWASDGKAQPASKSYDYDESADKFDRWLAEYPQRVGEAIWDDGYLAGVEWARTLVEEPRHNPFRKKNDDNHA
jgi:hypothetical protein